MNKKYEEMSTVEVLDMLKDMFPNFKTQLQDAIHAYECPFEKYCEAEAAFQLDEKGVDYPEDERKELEAIIAKRLFNSDTYIDGDVACYITDDEIMNFTKENKTKLIRFEFCYKGANHIIRARNTMEALGKFLTGYPLANHLMIDRQVKDNGWNTQYHPNTYFNIMMHEINYKCQRAADKEEYSFLITFKYNHVEYHCIINNVISQEEALGVFFFNHPNIRYLDIYACTVK